MFNHASFSGGEDGSGVAEAVEAVGEGVVLVDGGEDGVGPVVGELPVDAVDLGVAPLVGSCPAVVFVDGRVGAGGRWFGRCGACPGWLRAARPSRLWLRVGRGECGGCRGGSGGVHRSWRSGGRVGRVRPTVVGLVVLAVRRWRCSGRRASSGFGVRQRGRPRVRRVQRGVAGRARRGHRRPRSAVPGRGTWRRGSARRVGAGRRRRCRVPRRSGPAWCSRCGWVAGPGTGRRRR